MLRVGRILVILSGFAGVLLSLFGLLFAIGLGGPDPNIVAVVSASVALLVIGLVGVFGTVSERTWGPMVLAASSGAWAVIWASYLNAPLAAVAFGISALLAIAVAFGLWKTKTPEGPAPPPA